MAKVDIKGDQSMSVSVNDYSFSQIGKGLAGGISAESEPKPEPSNPDANVNPYSLKKCSESFGDKSDNINPYSASKIGRSLS